MSGWRGAWLVARWEFRRFIKWKQQAIGLLITAAMMAAIFGVQEVARRNRGDAPRVAVIGAEHLPALPEETTGGDAPVELRRHSATDLDSLRRALVRRDIRGILVLVSPDSAELLVSRDPSWRRALEGQLAAARRQRRMAESRLSATEVADIFAPVRLAVRQDEDAQRTRGSRVLGIFAITFMLLALFTGAANAFVSITGEKQLRVTEQVVSAIPPQSWMDGKILGLTGVALVGAINTALVILAFYLARSFARDGASSLALSAPPATVLVFILLVLLGSLFWLSLFSAVAATIDDPNSSMRSSMLFLPMVAAVPGAMAIGTPDSTFARVVALFPVTSPVALPVRMLLAEPPWWEIVVSIALLAAATWWIRLAAGRIFRLGMLMYGKEMSWGEMVRWARRA